MKFVLLLLALLLLPILFRMRRQGKSVGGWKLWVAVGGVALLWLVIMQFAFRIGGKVFIVLILLTLGVLLFFHFTRKK